MYSRSGETRAMVLGCAVALMPEQRLVGAVTDVTLHVVSTSITLTYL